jgi:hypothetical protein
MEAAGVEAFPIWDLPIPQPRQTRQHWLNNYVRLGLLNKAIGGQLGDRLLGIDLDIVIRANIDSLVETDAPVKFMCLKSRTWIQGGLILVTPGALEPDPWEILTNDPAIVDRARAHGFCGSDQAVLSELYYQRLLDGEFASWNESDGIAINEFHEPWRLFFRTGHHKCWLPGMPEADLYYGESGADPSTCPPDPLPRKSGKTPGGLFTSVRRYVLKGGRPR